MNMAVDQVANLHAIPNGGHDYSLENIMYFWDAWKLNLMSLSEQCVTLLLCCLPSLWVT